MPPRLRFIEVTTAEGRPVVQTYALKDETVALHVAQAHGRQGSGARHEWADITEQMETQLSQDCPSDGPFESAPSDA